MSNGGSVSIKIRTRVNASNAIIQNYAYVNSTTYDPNLINNGDDEIITVKTEADVGVIKLVSNQTAHYGDTVTWTIIVTNYGPNDAENVVLTDFIPEGLVLIGTPSRSQGHVYDDPVTGNGIWEIGTLKNGESVTCIFDSLINTTGQTIRNVVNVTTTSHDPDLSNNIAYNTTYVPEECDVAVLKSVNNLTPNKFDTVTWTITVVNHGPNVAKNVIVHDVLPAGLEYVSNTVPTYGSYQHTRNMWILDDLAVNVRHTLTITTRVVDTGLITNEVNVTTSTYDTNPENNYANETIDVPAIADLEVEKVVSNSTPNYGDEITWTITVTNNGPNNARNVYVTDKLPAGLIYVSHNAETGLYDPSAGIWSIGDLEHFDKKSLTIRTLVNVTNTTIENVATVYSTTPDSNESNNKDNDTIEVPPMADLAIDKTVDDHGPRKGNNITWIITVVNNGPDVAVNAVATDVLPEGLIFVNASGNGTYDVNTDKWTIGDLKNGETAVLYIVTTVNVTQAVITNTVNVTSDTPDPDETNNEDNSTIDVGHEADLGIVKVVSNSTPNYGDEITWTITVTNNGPDDAVEVFVTDTLPNGLVWISDNGNGTYDHTTGIWTIGTLHNHSHISLEIKTLVNITNANITNVAVVDSDTHDPFPENNTDNDTITVKALADLWLVKRVQSTAIFGEEIVWQLGVMNLGPNTAVDAYVEDVLPDGLIFTEYAATKGTYDNNTGIWTIGNLTSGETEILYIWTIVNKVSGNITNVAVANSSTEDPNPDNNKDNDTVNITSIADLEIIKLVSNKNPRFNETITWTITVKNNGPSPAENVNVTDKLPAGLIYVTDDSNGAYNKDTGLWTIGDLADGESKSLVITTIVNITNATITNVAVVNSSTEDSNPNNNKANNTTNVAPEADLSIVKLVSSNTTKIGENIVWTIIVKNNGPDAAVNVYVRDELPTDLVYVSHTTTKGIFDQNGPVWYINSLAKGETQTLTLTTKVNITNKTLVNNVSVTSDTYDPNETNNNATNNTTVAPKSQLVVEKLVSKNETRKGETITWTVTVTNKGPDASINTVVTDKLPVGLIFVESDGDYDNNTGIWNVGELANGESKSLVITTIVNITNTTIRNVANATSDNSENNTPGNNTTDVDPAADLKVVKTVSNNETKKGEIITWTVTVTNNGPDTAVNAKATDKLPAGLIYLSDDSNGAYNPVSGVWTIGDLANGAQAVLNIRTQVNITNKTIRNVVNVTSDTPDDNETNNKDNNTTTVDPEADLEVIKTVSNYTPNKGDIIIWTLNITNHGPDNSINVVVIDQIPDGLVFVDANGNPIQGNAVRFTIPELKAGESININVRTLVNASDIELTNEAIVYSLNVTDPNPDNNYDNETVGVNPKADLEVVKLVSNTTAKKGDTVTWTITVTNKGPNTAFNARATDKLPAGLTYVSHSADVGLYDPVTGTWLIGNLANGESKSLVITTVVAISNANITNIVVVTSDTPDDNDTNNEANNTTEVNDVADLEVIKTVSNSTPHKGDVITWTITVTNNGPSDAREVVVTDKLPAGLVYISADKAYNPVTGEWIIGDLANGASVVLNIQTLVNITNKTITNVAVVNSTTPDSNESNNKDNNTTDVAPEADLKVVKTVSNSTPNKGDIITWTITVTNNGPDTAVNAKVTDKLPAGLVFISANGNYDPTTGVWTIGNLASGSSVELNIQTLVNITNKTIENVAVGVSDTYDPNETNNEGNNTTDVNPKADVEIVKTVSNATAHKGDTVTWTITVKNNGPDTAVNTKVTDKLPAGLTYVSHTAEAGLYDQSAGIWLVGDLANGESKSLIITTIVDITTGNITNVAVVTSDTPDDNDTNNEANNTTEVNDISDLKLVKTVSNSTPHKGDIIIWTITVTNNGPSDARDVVVTDELPEGLVFISADGTYNPTTGKWVIGDLANGASVVLNIQTLVNITNKTITNVAVVNSTTPDSNESNNKDNNTTDVAPEADLEIIKTVSNSTPNKGDIITWTLTVINHGPDSALNVKITDEVPEGLAIILYGNKQTSRLITVNIPELKAGESHVFSFETLVEISNKNITNVAVVNSTTYDPNETNNEGNNTTNVNPEADLEAIKYVSNSTPHKGDIITWTIVVTNNGPDDARDVVVTDKLPAGLVFISANGNYDPTTGKWIVGNLANGATVSLDITTKVDISNSTITNIVVVESPTYDPNETNNEGNNTTDVDPEADLGVVKVVSNSNPHKGDIITWTITVTNNGPDSATNAIVTDKLPAGLVFISANGEYNADTGVWTVGNLANGESKSLVITTLVNITNTTIRNVANVTSDVYDPNKTNDEGNNTTDVDPEADLEIIKLVSDKTTEKGNAITWTIVVTNKGPDAALNVYVTDVLPAGLVYQSHTTTKGLFDSNSLVWYINALNKGESQTLTITTLVNVSGTTLVNNVNVTSETYDPNETNNKANNTTVVDKEKSADLAVIKVVNNTNPHKGDLVSWTITVTNNGPDGAKDVVVTDKLPAGLTFVSADGDYNKDTGIWTIGDLANGESKSLVIVTKVAVTNANITNIVVVTSSTDDPDKTNNEDNETTEVDPEADVKVVKTVSNPKPNNGDTITWTIVVTNLGPDTAKDVTVQEKLPAGLKLLKAKGTKGAYENGVWTVGDLTNGEVVTLVLTTKVTASNVEIRNIAVANTTTYDPNTSNNRDEEVTNPQPVADLELIKVADKTKVKVGDKIIWTITVINHGPDKAVNVRVNDWTLGDLEFISAHADTGEFDDEEGFWMIGDLESGESAVLQIICKALSETTAINFASVESDTPDPNMDNNYDNATVKVVNPDEPDTPDTPDVPDVPEKPGTPAQTPTLPATGNPIMMVILALLSIVGVSLRRKD